MTTPGYSGKSLSQKLGLKPGHRLALVHAPPDFAAALDPLPPDVAVRSARALPPGAMLWVAWPKKAARQPTDVTEDVVRRIGLATGLVDVKVCAVTEIWSGLKWVHRVAR